MPFPTGWQQEYAAAYSEANLTKPPVYVHEWSSGWYYIERRGMLPQFKPVLYRRKDIEAMTLRLRGTHAVPTDHA